MRSLFLILSVVSLTLFSCSSSNDDSPEIDQALISPPGWIQGKWMGNKEGLKYEGFRFIEKDIIVFQDGVEISQNDLIDGYINAGFSIKVEQEEEEGWYSIQLNYPLEHAATYSFKRESENEIILTQEDVVYERQ